MYSGDKFVATVVAIVAVTILSVVSVACLYEYHKRELAIRGAELFLECVKEAQKLPTEDAALVLKKFKELSDAAEP